MNKVVRLLLLAGLLALAVWLWTGFFPSPEKEILKRLGEIAELVSFPPNERPLTALTEVQQLCARLSPDVEIRVDAPGLGRRTVRGRDDVRQGLMSYRSTVNGLQVTFPDRRVVVAPDHQSAEVWLTVEARVPTDPDLVVQEMKLLFRHRDGDWLVDLAETVKSLR